MQKFVKQVMVVGAVVGMGVSSCTMLANAANSQPSTAEVTLESPDTGIKLTSAPTFDFGTNKMDGANIKGVKATVKDSLKVVNPGLSGGWHVTAKWSKDEVEKEKNKDNSSNLGGMDLKIYPRKDNVSDTSGNVSHTENYPTILHDEITLSNTSSTILNAEVGKGIGSFELKLSKEDVQLNIPAYTSAGTYKTTIEWALSDAPDGSVPTT